MSNASQPFDFSQFVPGFDFLKNLAGGAAGGSGGGAVPGLPGLASWVAPTLSVEEVDKRIQELKTVQYWLCLLYTSPSPRDLSTSRMPSSA